MSIHVQCIHVVPTRTVSSAASSRALAAKDGRAPSVLGDLPIHSSNGRRGSVGNLQIVQTVRARGLQRRIPNSSETPCVSRKCAALTPVRVQRSAKPQTIAMIMVIPAACVLTLFAFASSRYQDCGQHSVLVCANLGSRTALLASRFGLM